MKITVKAFIYSFLFICLGSAAHAQINMPDSVRVGLGAELASASGTGFGTGVTTDAGGTAAAAYSYGVGLTLRGDIPVMSHLYATATLGYISFLPTGKSSYSQQAILKTSLPDFNTIPIKVGLKWLLGNRFYVQGEIGETFLANKKELYALYGNSVTWAPQIGLVLPLKKRHTYIDAGLRYERTESFYNDSNHNTFWALHVAYEFNL